MGRAPIWGLLLILALDALGLPAAGAEAPVRVAVSVLPFKTFVEAVGGTQVRVQVLVPPGRSAETFEPTPRQIADLAGAELYVRTGVAFENAWLDRIRAVNPRLAILDARDGPPPRGASHRHKDDSHLAPGGATDPHVWTSPPLVKQMAAAIRDRLTALAPGHRAAFSAGYARLATELDALDQDLRARLKDLPARQFLVLHPSWGYFADRYDLTQIPIEQDGKEPGAQSLAHVVEAARRAGLKQVFAQPQFNPRPAQQVAEAIGGRVEVLDDLAADYAANLRHFARRLAEEAGP